MSRQVEASVSHRPTIIGFALTVVYLLSIAILADFRWSDIRTLTPNEFGDMLAGVFSPLAFLWLVCGYLQQGQELRHSARALYLQSEELKASVQQQEELVKVTREQLEFERQERKKMEEAADREALPTLVLAGTGCNVSDTNTRYGFELLNNGSTCTHLTIERPQGAPITFPELRAGKRVTFGVDFLAPAPRDFVIRVTFKDQRGRDAKHNFRVVSKAPADAKDFLIHSDGPRVLEFAPPSDSNPPR